MFLLEIKYLEWRELMYKMMVSDFDGTLVNEEDNIPVSTVAMIDKLRKNGYQFVISTGRCLQSVSYYNGDYQFIDYIVSCNGAYIYDVKREICIHKKNILIRHVKKIVQKYIGNHIIYAIDHKVWHLLSEKSAYEEEFDVVKEEDYLSFLSQNQKNIYKIEIYFETIEDAQKAIKEIQDMELKVNVNLQMNHNRYLIEITHQDVNKLEAIKKILRHEKLTLENVIAFGDGYNDIELIKNAGLGIVPENAVAEIKEIADSITLDYNHKGVEVYLRENEELLLSKISK